MKNSPLFTFLVCMTVIFLSSCKEEDPTSPVNTTPKDPEYNVNKPKDQVYPFEIASVTITGLSTLSNEYSGKFGGVSITLKKGTGNELFFVVPDISVGKHNLELSLNSNARAVEFTVMKGADLPDAQSFLTSFVNIAKTQISDNESVKALEGIVQRQQALLVQVESELNKLSPKEKFETVGVLSANSLLLPLLSGPGDRYSWSCLEANGQAFVALLESNKTLPPALSKLTQLPINSVSKSVALATLLNLRVHYLSLNSKAVALLDCRLPRSFGFDESGARTMSNQTGEPLIFESGVSRTFKLFAAYQSLITADRTNPLAELAAFAKGIDQIGDRLNVVVEVTNQLNSAFGLNVSNMANTDKVALAAEAEKEVLPLSNAEFSIQDINNNKVEPTQVISTADGVQIGFASKVGGTQNFGFKLVLENGPIKVVKEMQATVTLTCTLAMEVKVDGKTATATVTNAQNPVTFTWSNGGSGSSQSNLAPGDYTVTAEDNLGCEVTKSFTILDEPVSGTVADREGNVYATVKIGNQVWMAENLRVSTYGDGTAIAEVKNNTDWRNMTTGAFSWYNNDPAYDAVYGKLYNWYALNCCKICPDGWHVPTLAEWETLRVSLLPDSGGKMKSVAGWRSPNTGATNSSGFDARPGGVRGSNGNFFSLTEYGMWWVANQNSAISAPYMFLSFENALVQFANFNPKWNGAAIRCVKD